MYIHTSRQHPRQPETNGRIKKKGEKGEGTSNNTQQQFHLFFFLPLLFSVVCPHWPTNYVCMYIHTSRQHPRQPETNGRMKKKGEGIKELMTVIQDAEVARIRQGRILASLDG